MPIPVVGMTEASLLTACLLGRRFGLISFGQSSRWMYLDLVQRAGLAQRMVAFETVELANTASYLPGMGRTRPSSTPRRGQVQAGADAVVVAGAAMAGIAHRLRTQLPVPLLDGIAWPGGDVGAAWVTPARRVAPLTGGSTTIGIDPALSRLLSR